MISVFISPNEVARPRAAELIEKIKADKAFAKPITTNVDISVDVRFAGVLDVELKTASDMLSSVVTGHLYEQVLAMRELGQPAMVVVVGTEKDLHEAARVAAYSIGREDAHRRIESYIWSVRGFESNARAIGVQVVWFGEDWAKRLLSHVKDFSGSGDLVAYRPKPAENERQIAALCMLVPRLGPVKAVDILRRWTLAELFRDASQEELMKIPGIGKKTAANIMEVVK